MGDHWSAQFAFKTNHCSIKIQPRNPGLKVPQIRVSVDRVLETDSGLPRNPRFREPGFLSLLFSALNLNSIQHPAKVVAKSFYVQVNERDNDDDDGIHKAFYSCETACKHSKCMSKQKYKQRKNIHILQKSWKVSQKICCTCPLCQQSSPYNLYLNARQTLTVIMLIIMILNILTNW